MRGGRLPLLVSTAYLAAFAACFLVVARWRRGEARTRGRGALVSMRGKATAVQKEFDSWRAFYEGGAPAAYSKLEHPMAPVVRSSEYGPAESLPLFLIIGAQKSGTTSLRRHLLQNPWLGGSIVETVYLQMCDVSCADVDKQLRRPEAMDTFTWLARDYSMALMRAQMMRSEITINNGGFLFDTSPMNAYLPNAAKWAAALVPHVHLVMLVRNPVERYFSALRMELCRNQTGNSFHAPGHVKEYIEAAMENYRHALDPAEPECSSPFDPMCGRALFAGGDALLRGIYVHQIQNWVGEGAFHPSRLLVIHSDDFFSDFSSTIERVSRFVGIPFLGTSFHSDFKRPNLGQPDCSASDWWYESLVQASWDAGDIQELLEFYRPYNEALFEHIGSDLGWNDIPPSELRQKLQVGYRQESR
jgi:hypothetical protein